MPQTSDLLTFGQARRQMRGWICAYKPSKQIQRLEIKIHPVDMLQWLSLQNHDVKIYGANQTDTMAIAGIGEAVAVKGRRTESFKAVFDQLRSYLRPDYPYLQWYGGFCFDDAKLDDEWKQFGAYRFVLPRFELAAQEGRMIFCCNLAGKERLKNILKQLDEIAAARAPDRYPSGKGNGVFGRRTDVPGQNDWTSNIEKVLSDPSIQKVVLARKTSLYFKEELKPWTTLRQLKAVTPNSYHFAFQFGKAVFLGASPERLFRRRQRLVESEAIAGTVPKSVDPKILQNSDKNQREHHLVVDFIDKAFAEFCKRFQKSPYPEILTLANGHHLITGFQGELKDGVKDEDVLKFLHPTPALGGTPQPKAVQAIRGLEGFSRGWYAGPVGYVGLDWAEFVVAIRSGLAAGKRLSVFAGAGIVQGSQPADEWDEVENKISNFIKIIQ